MTKDKRGYGGRKGKGSGGRVLIGGNSGLVGKEYGGSPVRGKSAMLWGA